MKKKNNPEKEAIRLTRLWQEFGPNTYPIDIDDLINGAIRKSDFDGILRTKKGIFDSFEGSLVRTKNTSNWTILLNGGVKNRRRMRFTHAHELGHFMCHRAIQDRFEDSIDSLNDFTNQLETEANIFASWLLLPANIIRAEFDDCNWCTEFLRELGSRFECSLQASAIRYLRLTSKPSAFVVSRDGIIIWSGKSGASPYLSAYCFGDELPEMSIARKQVGNGEISTAPAESGFAWSSKSTSVESQYFDLSGLGYQYTCIEFIN